MKHCTKVTAAILNQLTAGLDYRGETPARKLDNAPGTYNPICVESIGPNLFALAHYGLQNGDMMRDPEMVFYKAPTVDGRWYPVSFRNDYAGAYRECMTFDDRGVPEGVRLREQREQADFAKMWAKNLKYQQDL